MGYNGVYFCGNSEEQLTQTLHHTGDPDTVTAMYSGYHSTGNSDGQLTWRPSHIEETDPIATIYITLMTTIPVVIQEDS